MLGNLEDAIPADAKAAARRGFIEMAKAHDFGQTGLWTRINALNSPWALDDILEIVPAAGAKLDVDHAAQGRGALGHPLPRPAAGAARGQARPAKPILIHAILETAEGVNNVEAIAGASPRMHGMSLGPADLAASRGMKTTRVGGGHPAYGILADPGPAGAARAFFQQDLWHYTLARMVDACATYGIKAFYGPFGDFSDGPPARRSSATPSCTAASAPGRCIPSQIDIAKRVFSLDPKEVAFAKRIVEAMPDGTGAAMIDGKMQDDATWKQAKVILDLAKLVASQGSRAQSPLWPVRWPPRGTG